jgi:plasmid replication initiation protein
MVIKEPGLKNKNVVIANTLTMSAQSLTLSEKRILFAAIAKAGGITGKVNLSAKEYAETYGMAQNQAYEQIKEAAKNIFNRYITLSKFGENNDTTRHFRWVEAYEYKEGLGYVTLVFTSSVMPYLLALEKNFTKYKLRQACALRSVYSWRLLELFEQQSKGWLLIDLEDFHHAMNSTNTHRKNFKDTRVHVIEPAIKELQEKDGWIVAWEPTKLGRKVISLKFVFTKKTSD